MKGERTVPMVTVPERKSILEPGLQGHTVRFVVGGGGGNINVAPL